MQTQSESVNVIPRRKILLSQLLPKKLQHHVSMSPTESHSGYDHDCVAQWHGPARGNIHINFQIRDEKSRVKGQVLSNDDDLHTVEKDNLPTPRYTPTVRRSESYYYRIFRTVGR